MLALRARELRAAAHNPTTLLWARMVLRPWGTFSVDRSAWTFLKPCYMLEHPNRLRGFTVPALIELLGPKGKIQGRQLENPRAGWGRSLRDSTQGTFVPRQPPGPGEDRVQTSFVEVRE